MNEEVLRAQATAQRALEKAEEALRLAQAVQKWTEMQPIDAEAMEAEGQVSAEIPKPESVRTEAGQRDSDSWNWWMTGAGLKIANVHLFVDGEQLTVADKTFSTLTAETEHFLQIKVHFSKNAGTADFEEMTLTTTPETNGITRVNASASDATNGWDEVLTLAKFWVNASGKARIETAYIPGAIILAGLQTVYQMKLNETFTKTGGENAISGNPRGIIDLKTIAQDGHTYLMARYGKVVYAAGSESEWQQMYELS